MHALVYGSVHCFATYSAGRGHVALCATACWQTLFPPGTRGPFWNGRKPATPVAGHHKRHPRRGSRRGCQVRSSRSWTVLSSSLREAWVARASERSDGECLGDGRAFPYTPRFWLTATYLPMSLSLPSLFIAYCIRSEVVPTILSEFDRALLPEYAWGDQAFWLVGGRGLIVYGCQVRCVDSTTGSRCAHQGHAPHQAQCAGR